MKGAVNFLILIVAVIAIFILGSSVFIVKQTQQALVLRFGQPVAGRGLVSNPGLHFKIPFIEDVVLVDKRILDLEMPPQEVLASDNTRIEVDAFLRYRIVDPLKFYQSVGTIGRGEIQLGFILNSAVRRVLSDADLTEIVSTEREKLMSGIRDQVNAECGKLGVLAVDTRIRRADLPKQISDKVFSRMQSEWAREAALNRAQGTEQAQEIKAKADRDVVVLLADAQQKADQIRGQGDASRNKIFAQAYGRDPDFFSFYRSMQAYETALKTDDTRFVLAPKSSFFRYFGAPGGGVPASPEKTLPGQTSGGKPEATGAAPAAVH